jgi:hypothetical protein
MNLRRWAALVLCLLLGICWAAPADAATKSIDACSLLRSEQAALLLGSTVTAKNVAATTPYCVYYVPKTGGADGQSPGLSVELQKGQSATYQAMLRGTKKITLQLVPHHIRVDGMAALYLTKPDGPYSSGEKTPTFTAVFVALKDGYLVTIGVMPLPNQAAAGRQALGDVLARL